MASVKNTDNQIVVPFPLWMRIMAGFFAAFGIMVFTALALTGWDTRPDFEAGLGLAIGFLLLSLPYLGLTVKVTFEKALGNITIRKCFWSLPYRTRCISKKQVQSVTTTWTEIPIFPDTYGVSIKIAGRKKPVKIGIASRKNANHLADRINRFVWLE